MADRQQQPSQPPLRSEFAGDPDMVELIELLVSELPRRRSVLASTGRRKNYREIQRLAHQLKGASAGYGYPTIGLAASKLETRLRAIGTSEASAQLSDLENELKQLTELCERAIAGKQ